MNRRTYFLLATLLLLFAIWLRFHNVMNIDIFGDEYLHVFRGQRIAIGETFAGLPENKWFYTLTLALFFPRQEEGLFLGRILSVFASIVTISTVIALGTVLLKRRVGLLAGLFYAIFPLVVLHERTALVDSLLAMLCTISVLLSYRLAKKPRLWMGILFALTLTAGYLTKVPGVVYFIVPALAAFVYGRGTSARLTLIGMGAFSAVFALGLRTYFVNTAQRQGIFLRDTHRASVSNLVFSDFVWPDTALVILRDSLAVLQAYLVYAGPVFLLAILAAVVLVLRSSGKHRDLLWYLFIPAIGFWSIVVLAVRPSGSGIPPGRYMVFNATLVVLFAMTAIDLLLQRLEGKRTLQGVVLALLYIPPLIGALFLTSSNPAVAILYPPDQGRFGTDFDQQDAARALALDLIERQDGERFQALAFTETSPFNVISGPQVGDYIELPSFTSDQWDAVQQRTIDSLLKREPMYMIEEVGLELGSAYEVAPHSFDEHPFADQGKLVGEYTSAEWTYRLYRLESMEDHVVDDVYEALTEPAEQFSEDYAGLRPNLPADQTTVVYPASHADVLAAEPLVLDEWPITIDAADEAFGNVASAGWLNFVLTDEANTDPDNQITLTALRTYYFVEDAFYGRVHHYRFWADDQTPELTPINTVYEDSIVLNAGTLITDYRLDEGLLLVATEWETRAPVQDSFVIFTHVVNQNGDLVAQYDSVPKRGLLPLTEWQPGEPITDRYAVQLPADLPPGQYDVLIGLYLPEANLRLRVTESPSGGPDHAVLGSFVVE